MFSKQLLSSATDEAVEEFVSHLSAVIQSILSKNKRNGHILEIVDQINIAKRENPEVVIKTSGPLIWKYREKICAEDASFFLKKNYEEDIKLAVPNGIPEMNEFEGSEMIITQMKHTWMMFTKEEQGVIFSKLKGLVKSYAKYISATKEAAKETAKEN